MRIPVWLLAILILIPLSIIAHWVYQFGEESGKAEAEFSLGGELPATKLPDGSIVIDNGGGQKIQILPKLSPGFVTHVEGYESETTINPHAFKKPVPKPRQPKPLPYERPDEQPQAQPPCGGNRAAPCSGSGWKSGYRPVLRSPNP